MTITLLAGSYKLHLGVIEFHLCSTEIAEHGQMGFLAQHLLEALCHLDAAAHHHYVDVVGGSLKKYVAHITAHDIALKTEGIGCLGYHVKDFFVKNLC